MLEGRSGLKHVCKAWGHITHQAKWSSHKFETIRMPISSLDLVADTKLIASEVDEKYDLKPVAVKPGNGRRLNIKQSTHLSYQSTRRLCFHFLPVTYRFLE